MTPEEIYAWGIVTGMLCICGICALFWFLYLLLSGDFDDFFDDFD